MPSKWLRDLEWKSPAKQTRSQRTIEALLDAAEKLFAARGADRTSVTDIAASCGCSIGALYHHFKDKAALKNALALRNMKRLEHAGERATDPARWHGATILDILRGYLEFSLEIERQNPGYKISLFESVKSDPVLLERLQSLEVDLFDRMRHLLLMRAQEIAHPDPELAVRFILDQHTGLIMMRLNKMIAHDQLASVSDEAFVEAAIQAAAAYLQIKSP